MTSPRRPPSSAGDGARVNQRSGGSGLGATWTPVLFSQVTLLVSRFSITLPSLSLQPRC